jgi:hypothetical protein
MSDPSGVTFILLLLLLLLLLEQDSRINQIKINTLLEFINHIYIVINNFFCKTTFVFR